MHQYDTVIALATITNTQTTAWQLLYLGYLYNSDRRLEVANDHRVAEQRPHLQVTVGLHTLVLADSLLQVPQGTDVPASKPATLTACTVGCTALPNSCPLTAPGEIAGAYARCYCLETCDKCGRSVVHRTKLIDFQQQVHT
jgi:hypothetical protein